jgi:outer membrane protein insertion porin family
MSGLPAQRRGAGRAVFATVAAALAFLGSASGQGLAAIDSLGFVGLVRVDPHLATQTVQLKPGDPLQPFRVSQSVRALYALGLFDQVGAVAEPSGDQRVTLVFHLTERAPIRSVGYQGQRFMGTDDLADRAALTAGQLNSPAALFRASQEIEKAYRDEGFARARVTPEVSADSSGQGVAVTFRIDEGPRVKVSGVYFTGATAFSQGALRGAVQLRPAGFLRKGRFTREKLDEDIQRVTAYYHNRGYKDATVTAAEPVFSADGRWAEITFQVTEGPLCRFAVPRWEGATVYPPAVLRSATLFRGGQAFDQSQIENTITEVTNLYTERGYLTGLRITPQLETLGDSVRVVFQVEEGRPSHVGEIRVVGNTATKERVIRRELSLYPGALLRRSLLLRSQRDAFATGFFEDVQIEFNPGMKEDEVDVTFRVKEKSSVTASAGAGYSSQAGLTGFVEFGHNNLFGNGQAVSIKVEHGSKTDFYDLSLTEPWLWGRPISAGLDLYKNESFREIYVSSGMNQSYWQSRVGGGVRVGFPWILRHPDYSRLAFGVSFTRTGYRGMSSLPVSTQKLLLSSQGSLARTYVSFNRNSTDNPFHPTLGTRTNWITEVDFGRLGLEGRTVPTAFYRITVDHRQYFVPFWRPVWMLRWRAGCMWPFRAGHPVVESDLFRLGGTSSFDYLRGYHDYYVVPEENISRDGARFPGGNVMFGLTSEIQFPVVDPVHGVLFMDAGDTWTAGYDVSLRDLKIGVGAGVTMEIPMLGPVGFYYGYGTETHEWVSHFTFGMPQ